MFGGARKESTWRSSRSIRKGIRKRIGESSRSEEEGRGESCDDGYCCPDDLYPFSQRIGANRAMLYKYQAEDDAKDGDFCFEYLHYIRYAQEAEPLVYTPFPPMTTSSELLWLAFR
ncbi:hypothetical protein M9H77_36053 [Catharanthus roseus]|uniref:Uncharacterized protein n=1 Tax=Catharanthus roseus TaxID=4058 RepID=A0ACB9ZSM9_CATRO|nr:hypothetical protein M9H77_36053 [Catharanthus roseus]